MEIIIIIENAKDKIQRLITPRSESARCPDTISYGVQDLVYTRVFAIIVVRPRPEPRAKEAAKETADQNPFQCLAFVCDSRQTARRLTFALAAAFKVPPSSLLPFFLVYLMDTS